MKVVIRLTEREELKALPIRLRHSPGMMLRDSGYIRRRNVRCAMPG